MLKYIKATIGKNCLLQFRHYPCEMYHEAVDWSSVLFVQCCFIKTTKDMQTHMMLPGDEEELCALKRNVR